MLFCIRSKEHCVCGPAAIRAQMSTTVLSAAYSEALITPLGTPWIGRTVAWIPTSAAPSLFLWHLATRLDGCKLSKWNSTATSILLSPTIFSCPRLSVFCSGLCLCFSLSFPLVVRLPLAFAHLGNKRDHQSGSSEQRQCRPPFPPIHDQATSAGMVDRTSVCGAVCRCL